MPDPSYSSCTGKLSSAYFVVWLNVISIRFGSVYYLNKCTETIMQNPKMKSETQPREESIEVKRPFYIVFFYRIVSWFLFFFSVFFFSLVGSSQYLQTMYKNRAFLLKLKRKRVWKSEVEEEGEKRGEKHRTKGLSLTNLKYRLEHHSCCS